MSDFFPVVSDQRQLLRSTPSFDLLLRRLRFFARRKLLAPNKFHREMVSSEATNGTCLMLPDAALNIIGVADVEATCIAMEHVTPKAHDGIRSELQAFDKLRPVGD
jgi:hypothetical protein